MSKESGRLLVWGNNNVGQLGQGHTDDVNEPTVLVARRRRILSCDGSAQFTILVATEPESEDEDD
ncbi:hypothetical protein H696_00141 [Fonticula alba]|uniref:Regulator of chromosome condensation n=1 Tax=Fonticula alba TaxID=691883 RepID=A0A058ZDS9_FONAL|nr:hypothetical protein H696_00141 [Fonticula alba]KCV72550.1 hypothetical protein H696_00141 [Fonticula alba]|eukprot:XP_009492251.1 hypothetical protein H696_00141 [Fonticula alba]